MLGFVQAKRTLLFITGQQKKCLLYGLQRSGTNYVEKIVAKNIPEIRFVNDRRDRSSPLNKHFRLYRDKAYIPTDQYRTEDVVERYDQLIDTVMRYNVTPDLVIVVIRHPFHWYRSYLSWAELCGWDQSAYAYIREWNLFYGAWESLAREAPKEVLIFRYEDVLAGYRSGVPRLCERLGIEGRDSIDTYMSKVPVSGRMTEDKIASNLRPVALSDFPKWKQKLICEILDFDLVKRMGYSV